MYGKIAQKTLPNTKVSVFTLDTFRFFEAPLIPQGAVSLFENVEIGNDKCLDTYAVANCCLN